MDYVLIVLAQIFGILFHTWLKIKAIDDRRPDDSFWEVMGVFYSENLLSVILSFVILAFTIFLRFVIELHTDLEITVPYYELINIGLSLIIGYQGQKIIYKALDKGTGVVERKLDDKIK